MRKQIAQLLIVSMTAPGAVFAARFESLRVKADVRIVSEDGVCRGRVVSAATDSVQLKLRGTTPACGDRGTQVTIRRDDVEKVTTLVPQPKNHGRGTAVAVVGSVSTLFLMPALVYWTGSVNTVWVWFSGLVGATAWAVFSKGDTGPHYEVLLRDTVSVRPGSASPASAPPTR